MADWIGDARPDTAHRYAAMAERELAGVSPTYEAICRGVAADADFCARLDTLPAEKRQPNLLLAAVRFHDGPVVSWRAFRDFATARWDDLVATMLARRTQTNEAGRDAVLRPALAQLARPVALLEVGASAGLCLFPERWEYRYTTPDGEHVIGAGAQLHCRADAATPLPTRLPHVVWRAGLDLEPLDVTDPEDARWLEALVWPEQTERFATLHAAVALAQADPPRIVRGDLRSDLETLARDAPPDATLVVFHSAVLAYVPEVERPAFVDAIERVRATRPVVWLANEAPRVLPGGPPPRSGPSRFVLSRDGVPLARTAPHGQAIEWLA